MTALGSECFKNCAHLESVRPPESPTEIGGRAFDGCRSLAAPAFPRKLKTTGTSALRFTGAKAAVLPDTVTEIGGGAFSNCPKLVISAGSAAIEHAKRKKIRRGSL